MMLLMILLNLCEVLGWLPPSMPVRFDQMSAELSYIEISLPGQFATSLISPPPG